MKPLISDEQLRLHMGELDENEILVARAAFRYGYAAANRDHLSYSLAEHSIAIDGEGLKKMLELQEGCEYTAVIYEPYDHNYNAK